MRIIAVGLIALVTLVGTVESEEQQKFKFGDLFKKSKKTETESSSGADNKEGATKKTEETISPTSSGSTKSTATKKETSKPSEGSVTDQLKTITDKLGSDPDALLRTARERMRAMQAKDGSSKKAESTEKKKTEPTEKPKAVAKATPTPAPVAAPVKIVKPTVTAGAVKSAPKTAATARPPSLAPTSAVAAASAVVKKDAPPENLQASLVASNVPLPKPLVPEKLKKKNKSKKGGVEITSDEAETDMAANTVIFVGNVELHEPTFHLQCDKLVVFMNDKDDNSGSQFREAIATGAMVVVERVNDKGEKDVGHSRKVVYDARTGDIALSGGPPVLQSDGGAVETAAEDAVIILKKDGNHRVKNRGKFIIPVKGKAGEKKAGPSLLPSKLGDISTRKK